MSGTLEKICLIICMVVLVCICLLLSLLYLGRERPTELTFEDGNPPKFKMRGSGDLEELRFRGWHKQREALGEEAFLYWVIEPHARATRRSVEGIDTITYGQVPKGYVQVYPEDGSPPPVLNEKESYTIRLETANAPGAVKRFKIRDSKIEELPN